MNFFFIRCLSNTYMWETQGDHITFSRWIQHSASFMRDLDDGRGAGFCVLPCQGFWCLSQELGSFVLFQQKVQLMQGAVWAIFLLNLSSVIHLGELRKLMLEPNSPIICCIFSWKSNEKCLLFKDFSTISYHFCFNHLPSELQSDLPVHYYWSCLTMHGTWSAFHSLSP